MLKCFKRGDTELRILFLGLDNSGKTTILRKLGGEDITQVSPTQVILNNVIDVTHTFLIFLVIKGFVVSSLMHKQFKLIAWDVGGQKGIRPYWRNYFASVDAIVSLSLPIETLRGLLTVSDVTGLRNRQCWSTKNWRNGYWNLPTYGWSKQLYSIVVLKIPLWLFWVFCRRNLLAFLCSS